MPFTMDMGCVVTQSQLPFGTNKLPFGKRVVGTDMMSQRRAHGLGAKLTDLERHRQELRVVTLLKTVPLALI